MVHRYGRCSGLLVESSSNVEAPSGDWSVRRADPSMAATRPVGWEVKAEKGEASTDREFGDIVRLIAAIDAAAAAAAVVMVRDFLRVPRVGVCDRVDDNMLEEDDIMNDEELL